MWISQVDCPWQPVEGYGRAPDPVGLIRKNKTALRPFFEDCPICLITRLEGATISKGQWESIRTTFTILPELGELIVKHAELHLINDMPCLD